MKKTKLYVAGITIVMLMRLLDDYKIIHIQALSLRSLQAFTFSICAFA